jgi:hypothetical protein
MMEIKYISAINNLNPKEKNCTVILYALSVEDGKETGRFVLDKKIISGNDFDLYINQTNQTIDEKFLQTWEQAALQPLTDVINALVNDSNK